ncbi:hypothetical protein D3C79_909770 [compost metagenome]
MPGINLPVLQNVHIAQADVIITLAHKRQLVGNLLWMVVIVVIQKSDVLSA